jgi:histidinol-phosphate aminotransferase
VADYDFTSLADSLPQSVPFVGPEALERRRGKAFRARIGANESVFGPSPKAIAAMQAEAASLWQYGDPENYDLKAALAAHHGVAPENVVVGEGIDALFGYMVRLFVEPGVTVATSFGAYPTFNFHVVGFGGHLVTVPYRDDREDPQALLDLAVREKARLIYLANPDNPMASWSDAAAIEDMIARLPDRCLLVLDEAYADFAPAGSVPPLDVSNAKVLRFRTFSKAHGLAGARVGYALGEAGLVGAFDKVRNHFGVNRMAQVAALASLGDGGHMAGVIAKVGAARQRIAAIAADNGLRSLPSATNFVAVDCGGGGALARAVLEALGRRDVFVRMPGVAPLDRCIRISAGLADDLDLLQEALPAALAEARSSA